MVLRVKGLEGGFQVLGTGSLVGFGKICKVLEKRS